jgi:hypothetical protein
MIWARGVNLLSKRLGGQRVKDALRLLDEGRWNEALTWDICGMCFEGGNTYRRRIYIYINTYSMGKSCDQWIVHAISTFVQWFFLDAKVAFFLLCFAWWRWPVWCWITTTSSTKNGPPKVVAPKFMWTVPRHLRKPWLEWADFTVAVFHGQWYIYIYTV